MRLWMSTELASLALAGAVVAGCGSAKAPAVANLGAATTSSTPNRANGESPSSSEEKAQLATYVSCLQAGGVQAAIQRDGTLLIGQHQGQAGDVQEAQKACRKLIPKGGIPKPTQTDIARRVATAIKFAACMRKHGLPEFPDPNAGGGFMLSASTDGGVDPSSPQFQSAQKACQSYQPGRL
jgi:hypothetical protein